MRINAIQLTTKDYKKQMQTKSNEHAEEINNERILLEPILHDTEDLHSQEVAQGMTKEVQQMKDQSVFTEIDGNTLTPEQQANIIESRWDLKQKHHAVRACVVATAPLLCLLTILLTMALVYNWSVSTGDVSIASLHAEAISYNLVMRPPHEFYSDDNRHIMWRLNKAMYGLRSSPKQ